MKPSKDKTGIQYLQMVDVGKISTTHDARGVCAALIVVIVGIQLIIVPVMFANQCSGNAGSKGRIMAISG
jgi:hypothetical protein